MNSIWSKKWKKCLLWAFGYMNVIAFALVGGYVIVKNDDEELKKTTKTVFVVTLIFTAISAFFSLFYTFGSFFDGFITSGAYDFYDVGTDLVAIAKIVVFAIFVIRTLTEKEALDNNQSSTTEND